MTLTIRDARLDDADAIAHGNIAMALEAEHKRLDPTVVGHGVRAALENKALGRYFVAERDGRYAGQLLITYEWSDWRNGTFWWIQSVYVEPDARRQGVFRALFRHVETLAKSQPAVCGLRLYVERDNARAQRTYEACGLADGGYVVMEVDYSNAIQPSGDT